MNSANDFLDFIGCLNRNSVEFVLAGAYAVAHHGSPRATGDLDVWIRPTPDNAVRTLAALRDFGFGSLEIGAEDLLSGKVIQLGRAPVRIDLLSTLDGVSSDEIWDEKESGKFGDAEVHFLGRETLLKNKRAVGRHKDLADIEALGEDKEP